MGQNKYEPDGNYTVACDFGHRGKDLSVEILGEGNRPYRVRSWNITKTTEMAQILATTCGNVAKSRVMLGADCIGPGAGVGDDIETHHKWLAARLERCTHKDPLYEPRFKGQIAFDNLRSQMWWKLREDMMEGTLDLSAFMAKDMEDTGLYPEEGYFDEFYMLQEEILFHTFRIQNGKVIVISKEDLRKPESLGRSPDFADALVIWNWVRRHHYAQETHSIDQEYQVDDYMTKFMQDEFDPEEDDEAGYSEMENYDAGIYEDY